MCIVENNSLLAKSSEKIGFHSPSISKPVLGIIRAIALWFRSWLNPESKPPSLSVPNWLSNPKFHEGWCGVTGVATRPTPVVFPYLPSPRSISSRGLSFIFIGFVPSPPERRGFVYVPVPVPYALVPPKLVFSPPSCVPVKFERAFPNPLVKVDCNPPRGFDSPPDKLFCGLFKQLVRPDPAMVPVIPGARPEPRFRADTLPVRFCRLVCSPASVLEICPMLLTSGAVTGLVKVTWWVFERPYVLE